jgi:hypothetical protein
MVNGFILGMGVPFSGTGAALSVLDAGTADAVRLLGGLTLWPLYGRRFAVYSSPWSRPCSCSVFRRRAVVSGHNSCVWCHVPVVTSLRTLAPLGVVDEGEPTLD